MLPLLAKANLAGWSESGLFKIAGLREFSSNQFPIARMLLDLRAGTQGMEKLVALPWGGLLGSENFSAKQPVLSFFGDPAIIKTGDVVEVDTERNKVSVRYRRGDIGNVLFATEQCNNFCVMCSQPPRVIDDGWRVSQLHTLIDLVDKDEPSLAISGGEPTLLGAELARLIGHCAEVLPETQVHVLSNGRAFADRDFALTFRDLHPSLSWGIPLYGDTFALHDYVVQASGAFAETVRGLYALNEAQQTIEVRVVLVKPTFERLPELARFIFRNVPFVKHVALMGVEPIGFARANHQALWADPMDFTQELRDSTDYLFERGIAVSLYNLPLCTIPKDLWGFARRSISHWKQDFLPICAQCDVREQCGGFFSWVTPEWTSRGVIPIKVEGEHA